MRTVFKCGEQPGKLSGASSGRVRLGGAWKNSFGDHFDIEHLTFLQMNTPKPHKLLVFRFRFGGTLLL